LWRHESALICWMKMISVDRNRKLDGRRNNQLFLNKIFY
jgi:hypothetical protein